MLYLVINISGREGTFLNCDFELKPLTVIMGPPRSGKSTLLRLVFNTVYASLNGLPATNDLIAMASNYLSGRLRDGWIKLAIINADEDELNKFKEELNEEKIDTWKEWKDTWKDRGIFLECSAIEELGCSVERGLNPFSNVILIPTDVEAVIKYRLIPIRSEPYIELGRYLNDLILHGIQRNEKILKQLPFFSEVVDQLGVDRSRLTIIEKIAGAEIDITYSSSYVNTLLMLEALMLNEYIRENSLVLIDNIDSYLHPAMGQDKLALILWAMVNNGIIVMLSTHDLIFLDTLRHIKVKDYNANVNIDWSKMTIIVPKP